MTIEGRLEQICGHPDAHDSMSTPCGSVGFPTASTIVPLFASATMLSLIGADWIGRASSAHDRLKFRAEIIALRVS